MEEDLDKEVDEGFEDTEDLANALFPAFVDEAEDPTIIVPPPQESEEDEVSGF